jgi:hypothetical protein
MNSDTTLRLELIAAKAKQLAVDLEHGKLWPGDLSRGLQEISEQLSRVQQDSRTDL